MSKKKLRSGRSLSSYPTGVFVRLDVGILTPTWWLIAYRVSGTTYLRRIHQNPPTEDWARFSEGWSTCFPNESAIKVLTVMYPPKRKEVSTEQD